ncbi:hypothetical protein AB0L06_01530 [Spirillospora sp. NPDC052269]
MPHPERHLAPITDQSPLTTAPSPAAAPSPPVQPTGDLSPLATAWHEALDIAELQEDELRMRRIRFGLAAAFFTMGATVTGAALATLHPISHLPTVTISTVPAAIVAVVALAGLTRMFQDATNRVTETYRITRNGWRLRLARRWYAPGSYVRLRHEPHTFAVVLGWAEDPACAQPWVLIQQDGQSARFVPLHHIQPIPPRNG